MLTLLPSGPHSNNPRLVSISTTTTSILTNTFYNTTTATIVATLAGYIHIQHLHQRDHYAKSKRNRRPGYAGMICVRSLLKYVHGLGKDSVAFIYATAKIVLNAFKRINTFE